MTVSRHCPVCGGYALAFEAAATPNDNDVIAVIGRCQQCKYMFKFDFHFDEMQSDNIAVEGPEHSPIYRNLDQETPPVSGERESAVKQHQRWLGQDRQTPGEPYDPGRVSTPPREGPPEEKR